MSNKSILVIDMPEEYMGSNIDVKLYGKYQTIHERYVNKLRPLPKEKGYELDNAGYPTDIEDAVYCSGWNDCLVEITREG